jgi:hypothetical protein
MVGLALKITRQALANETHSYQVLGYLGSVANGGLSSDSPNFFEKKVALQPRGGEFLVAIRVISQNLTA